MSEGKLASGMVNGLLHGKNSIESQVQAGILLQNQDSTLVREKSEGSFARSSCHRESPALIGPISTQPFTPIPLWFLFGIFGSCLPGGCELQWLFRPCLHGWCGGGKVLLRVMSETWFTLPTCQQSVASTTHLKNYSSWGFLNFRFADMHRWGEFWSVLGDGTGLEFLGLRTMWNTQRTCKLPGVC